MKLNNLPKIDGGINDACDANVVVIPTMRRAIPSSDHRALSLWMRIDSVIWFNCENF
jgi:hypothetical protein